MLDIRFGKLKISPGNRQSLCLFLFRDMGVVKLETRHLPPYIGEVALIEIEYTDGALDTSWRYPQELPNGDGQRRIPPR